MTTQQQMSSLITLRQRSAFAVQHLMAAAQFSRQCGEIEQTNRGKDLGAFFDQQIACVSATIMLCVASLESNINEYFSDPEDVLKELSPGARIQFVELVESKPILEKYDRTLSAKELETFNRGGSPFQEADLLVAIRNELVHFHPEWHDEQDRHRKLGDRLQYRFALSPFIAEEAGVVFPQRFISHGCTKWAVASSLNFMKEFSVRAGLTNRFEKHESKCRG